MTNRETNLPGPLDVLLRDLHTLWCEEDPASEPGWHLADADPIHAAIVLANAIWSISGAAASGDTEAAAALD